MICSKCGNRMNDSDMFCSSCGERNRMSDVSVSYGVGALIWLVLCFLINLGIIIFVSFYTIKNVIPDVVVIVKHLDYIPSDIIGFLFLLLLIGLMYYFLLCSLVVQYFALIKYKTRASFQAMIGIVLVKVGLTLILWAIFSSKSRVLNYLASDLVNSINGTMIGDILNPFHGLINLVITYIVLLKYWPSMSKKRTVSTISTNYEDKWLCHHCNEINPRSSLFCRGCGKIKE